MDVKELIESGILERFVLGETSAGETSLVLSMAAENAEVQEELDRIEETLQATVMLGAVAAPERVKEQFLESIKPGFSEEKVSTPLTLQYRSFSKMATAAAIALLVVSAGVNVWLYAQWKSNERELVALQQEKQLLAENDKKMEAAMKVYSEKMSLMENPDVSMTVMHGTPKHPGMLANVYWNKGTGETYIDLKNLPKAPKGKQYQLWAIADGKPIDAGVFDAAVATQGLIKMKPNMKQDIFAVTLEKMGGSETPTMDQMVMIESAP